MFSLEPLLRERLETIDLAHGVHGVPELQAEKPKPAPCIYVAYAGYRVLETSGEGKKARIATRWLVIATAKNVAKAADGAAARESSGPLALVVLNKLMGWRPGPDHQPLHLVPAPQPQYQAGLLYLPLAFETVQVLKGE